MGVKVFRDSSRMGGSGGGGSSSSSTDTRDRVAKLGRDGMTMEFLFLNDLPGPGVSEDEMLVQCYIYKWVEGMTKKKDGSSAYWKVDIPDGDDLPEEFRKWLQTNGRDGGEKKGTFTYIANIFILRCYDTASGSEVELSGNPVVVPWKDKKLIERVRLLYQGNDTSRQVFVEGQDRKNSGADSALLQRITKLDRFHGDNRTKYQMRFGNDAKLDPEVEKEVMSLRLSILGILEDEQRFGIDHWRRKVREDAGVEPEDSAATNGGEPGSDQKFDETIPGAPTEDGAGSPPDPALRMEGDGDGDDGFSNLTADDIKPDLDSKTKTEFVG